MQIICQNGQQQNVYLLVHLLELIGQNKLPYLIKTGRAEYKLKLENP